MAATTASSSAGGRPGTDAWRVDLSADTAELRQVIAARRAAADDREAHLRLSGAEPRRWPSDAEVRELVAGGVALVSVVGEIRLGEDTADTSLHFLRFLRDALSHGLRVRWDGCFGAGLPVRAVSHLIPPAGGTSLALNPAVAAWRQRFAYGRCYWRAGPGFVQVSDARVSRAAASWTIADPVTVELFTRLMQPAALTECRGDPAAARAIADLRDKELVLQLGDRLLSLPYRMRRWPVMYRRDRDDLRAAFEARRE